MRTDLLRWGGVFSLLLAVLFAIVLALGFGMGVTSMRMATLMGCSPTSTKTRSCSPCGQCSG